VGITGYSRIDVRANWEGLLLTGDCFSIGGGLSLGKLVAAKSPVPAHLEGMEDLGLPFNVEIKVCFNGHILRQ
jgi:hypothetical protein